MILEAIITGISGGISAALAWRIAEKGINQSTSVKESVQGIAAVAATKRESERGSAEAGEIIDLTEWERRERIEEARESEKELSLAEIL